MQEILYVLVLQQALDGDYVLLKPRVQANTLVLWVTPAAVGLAGAIAALFFLRRRRDGARQEPLTPEELDALAKLDQ